jgi:hypothetical protein
MMAGFGSDGAVTHVAKSGTTPPVGNFHDPHGVVTQGVCAECIAQGWNSAASDNWESISHTPTKDDVFVILSHFETSGYDICECVRKDRIMASAFGATLPPVYGYKTTSKKPIDNSNCVGKHIYSGVKNMSSRY